ncbi:MAG: Sensor histidine kinase RcsC [Phycisphaerae bacterium]|nr:Sensor histidine kinase RcsC [Phycisphaerae bacterium]
MEGLHTASNSSRTVGVDLNSLEAVVRASQTLMAIYEPGTGVLRLANDPLSVLLGYKPGQLAGLLIEELVQDGPGVVNRLRLWRQQLSQTGTQQVELRFRHQSGEPIWMEMQGTMMTAGVPPTALLVFHDLTAQKETHETLAEREVELRELFDSAPVGFVHADAGGMIRAINAAYIEIFQLQVEPEAAIGQMSLLDNMQFHQAGIQHYFWKIYSGKRVAFDARVRLAGTRFAHVQFRGTPLLDDAGQVKGVIVIAQDVTGRRQNELELRRMAAQFESLFENLPVGILFVDRYQQVPILANKAAAELTGQKNLVAAPGATYVRSYGLEREDGSEYPELQLPIRQVEKSGKRSHVDDLVIRRVDGSRVQVEVWAAPVNRWGSPEFDTIVALFQDVTQRKEAERALVAEQQFGRALLENLSEGVVVCDQKGRLVLLNSKHEKFFGLQPREYQVVPEQWAEYYGLYLADGKTMMALEQVPLWRALQGETIMGEEMVLRRAGESPRRVLINATPFRGSNGELLGAVCIDYDITERVQEQEQWYRMEKMQSIARLAAGVAHEFNNLLVTVLGNASLIHAELPANHEWRPLVEAVMNSAERGAAMTRQLLTYARSGPIAPRRLSLRTVVANCLPLCRSILTRNLAIDFTAGPAEDQAEIDPSQVQQILLNLVQNAIEAMPHGGHIRIDTFLENGPENTRLAGRSCACLLVADQGEGMDPKVMDHLFEPFFSTRQFGRGMGLASVHGIVQNHGGEIRVQSRPGQGTTVLIYIPRPS